MGKGITEKFYTFLLVLSLFGIIIGVGVQVFFRYVLNSPLIWTDELSRLSFCWFTFMGSSLASHDDKHLKISFFYNKFSSRAKKVVYIFNHLMIFIFSLILLYSTYIQIGLGWNLRSASTRMPLVIFTISIFIGFMGITFYSLHTVLIHNEEVTNA